MQGRGDVHGFIETFAGDDRYIVDYLVEEVLSRQPERVRSFLAQTSILDRLSGPLCNAITGREDGRGMLESLERGNLFVVPLDDKRQWYRYHHLFADVLHAHSMEEEPDRVPILHRRASEWYENNGLRADAIHHALAAEDFERAAGLVELAERAMRTSNQEDTLREWLKALPDELIRARPVLSAGYAWTLLVRGEIEAADARLQDAERWLDAATGTSERPGALSAEMVVVDEEGYRSLPGSIAAARTFYAQALGDFPSVEKYARLALELIPESNYFERAIPGGILALAYWAKGDLEAAHRSLTEGMANLRRSGHIDLAISGTFILAHIRATQGRLHEAIGMCERSLQLAMEQGGPVLRGTADIHVGLSELNVEQGDLAAQDAYQYNSRVARARLKEVQGDLNGALDILDEADRVYTEGVVPNLRPAATLKTRVWVAQSRPAEAQGWVHKRGLSADDDLSYLTEFEHITLAKVLIARHKSDRQERQIHEAAGLLERLLKAAEEGGRTRSVIEILVLQAIAYQARGDTSRALNPLERALILAEPEGYVQIFVDEGEAMRDLLRHAAARDVASSYARRLLSAFDGPSLPASTLVKAAVSDLAEPLTGREVEVLRLVAAGMRNQEIADQLFISLSTVKRHIANAYGKLGVGHRTEAVARANELNLL